MTSSATIHSGHVAGAAAADHAERETPEWKERAAEIFMEFALTNGGEFQTEQVREYAAKKGFPNPPDSRAWGHIATSLRRAGRIAFITNRSTQSRTCNSHPRAVWKAVGARVLKTDLFE